jgi:hypothetical protein
MSYYPYCYDEYYPKFSYFHAEQTSWTISYSHSEVTAVNVG